MILNLKGAEAAISTTGNGNSFSGSTCIKLNVDANTVITLNTSDDTFIGNTTIIAPATVYIEKGYTDKIVADVTCYGTPVGFTIS